MSSEDKGAHESVPCSLCRVCTLPMDHVIKPNRVGCVNVPTITCMACESNTPTCWYCKRNDNWKASRMTSYCDIGGIPHKITCCSDCMNNPEIEKAMYALTGDVPPER